MPDAVPHLPLADYQFHFRALTGAALPEDAHGLWHGVFGLHLRRLVCQWPGNDCPACPARHHCAHAYLFVGPRPPEAELMRRYERIPVPHILSIPPDFPRRVAPGQPLSIGVILVGQANAHLPLVTQALAAAGAGGLGAHRVRLLLTGLDQWLPDAAHPHRLQDTRMAPARPPQAPLTPPLPMGADGQPTVRLDLVAPYQQSGGDLRPAAFDPGLLLMAVVRRVSLLQYFYTGVRLAADFPALKAASARVWVRANELVRVRSARFAAGHGRRLDTGGLVGSLTLGGDGLPPLWPYLHLGQWLHVGKSASMGLGRYRLSGAAPGAAQR